jgi:hypothetical protein
MGSPRLSAATLQHLKASGLTEATIAAAGIKDALSDPTTAQLLSSHHVDSGYFIPYHNLKGELNGHYRIRVLKGSAGSPKYLQPSKHGNHAYIPTGFSPGWEKDTDVPILITEGEKKALAASQFGMVCIGVGGVDSWRSRTFTVNSQYVSKSSDGKSIVIRLENGTAGEIQEEVAPELMSVEWNNRRVVIVYDSDTNNNADVQRAAFDFALWLDTQGAKTGQFFLEGGPDQKVGLDDWLLHRDNREHLVELLEDPDILFPFPMPPHPRHWIQRELDARPSRNRQLRVARASLAWLDAQGRRYKDSQDNYYFFEESTKILHPFRLDQINQLRQSSFGNMLINHLGMQTADGPVMSRLGDLFASYEPITHVAPRKVLSQTPDALYYQVSDGRIARVNGESIEFVDNGTDGQLFLPDSVVPVDEDRLAKACANVRQPTKWLEALETVNLQPMGGLTIEQTRLLLAAHFYLSPWMNRWRGMMTPLEIAVAEPNSGKTFLFNLRKGILTGYPDLEGLPEDFRGWVSAISAAPGMWVCDNLGSVRTDFWHRLNDELARLITDPSPTIEMRKLYTTSQIARVPINTTFAITTIKNPFTAPDILQRSLIYELQAIPIDRRNGNWYTSRMDARTEWLAEHLVVIQRFLRETRRKWNPNYISGFRLVHYEQALLRMGEVLGRSEDMAEIVKALPGVVASTVAEYDPIIEALVMFCSEWKRPTAFMSDVVEWVQGDMERRYSAIKTLSNTILLGRYIKSHTYDIEQATGVTITRQHNATVLRMPDPE